MKGLLNTSPSFIHSTRTYLCMQLLDVCRLWRALTRQGDAPVCGLVALLLYQVANKLQQQTRGHEQEGMGTYYYCSSFVGIGL
jgi:hypothetical protein